MAADPKLLSLSRYDDAIGAEAFVHIFFYDDAAVLPAPTETFIESPT